MTAARKLPELTLLALEKIRLDGGTQSRAELSEKTVAWYERLLTQVVPPPIVVFFDGDAYWLSDGFHRLAAAKSAGLTEINAEVRRGTNRDALLFGMSVPQTAGLERTDADRRKMVSLLLQDPEWSTWPQKKIGATCGVSEQLVSKIKTSLHACRDGAPVRDGTVTVTRGGTTYALDTTRIGKKKSESTASSMAQAPSPPATPAVSPSATPGAAEVKQKGKPKKSSTEAFDQKVKELLDGGRAPYEVSDHLGCTKQQVYEAKRRMGLTRKNENPLSGLVRYAVEFSDTWKGALSNSEELWQGASKEQILEFSQRLGDLVNVTKQLLNRLNKEAKKRETP